MAQAHKRPRGASAVGQRHYSKWGNQGPERKVMHSLCRRGDERGICPRPWKAVSVRRVFSAVAVTTVAVAAPLVATSHSVATPKADRTHQARALVSLRPGTAMPWRARGVHVVDVF